jgi:ribosomal protein L35
MRSERREAVASVAQVCLHYLELASLRVGVPQHNGDFMPLDMSFIAQKLGWRTAEDEAEDKALLAAGKLPKRRGIQRVQRAIDDMKGAGYVTVHRRFEKCLGDDNAYRGLPAIRCFSERFFHEIGITLVRLNLRRNEAAKRLRKKYQAFKAKLANEKMNFHAQRAMKEHEAQKKRESQGRRSGGRASVQDTLIAKVTRLLPENRSLSEADFAAKYPQFSPDNG